MPTGSNIDTLQWLERQLEAVKDWQESAASQTLATRLASHERWLSRQLMSLRANRQAQ